MIKLKLNLNLNSPASQTSRESATHLQKESFKELPDQQSIVNDVIGWRLGVYAMSLCMWLDSNAFISLLIWLCDWVGLTAWNLIFVSMEHVSSTRVRKMKMTIQPKATWYKSMMMWTRYCHPNQILALDLICWFISWQRISYVSL